ncbi:MAG: SDR family NAD(P)-dependent oxidoreductase, partial [Streptosporangiaceae bacterium]
MSGDDAGPFSGKVAVVTGSSSGIGLEVARHFGASGARVITNGRTAERAQAAARTIEEAGGTAVGVGADLSSYEGAERLIRGAIDAFGGVD